MATKSPAAVISSMELSHLTDLERKETIRAARALCLKLEKPIETVLRIAWQNPTLICALRVCIDLKIFDLLSASENPSSPTSLAAASGSDPALLARLLRHVSAMGYIQEVSADLYGPTIFSEAMRDPSIYGGIPFIYDAMMPSLARIPQFLAETGYVDPHDPENSPWTFGHGTSDPMFKWLKSNPKVAGSFNSHMTGYAQALSPWLEFYPFKERISSVCKATTDAEKPVLMVDIGGGVGHDLVKLQTACGPLPGRLILQELSQVIHSITALDASIETMTYDFFTTQPIKGAYAYYFHSILHNWGDADVLRILQAVKPALVQGRSKLLVNDYVLQDFGADPLATSLDIGMMALLQSQERTQQQWAKLFEQAGFKVVSVWRSESGQGQALLEAELAD